MGRSAISVQDIGISFIWIGNVMSPPKKQNAGDFRFVETIQKENKIQAPPQSFFI